MGREPRAGGIAMLAGAAGFALSLAVYQLMLDRVGVADVAPLTAALALAGWLFGIRLFQRSEPQRAEAHS